MTNIELEIIVANIKSQLNGDYIAPIVLASSPGVGKTSAIKNLAKKNNLALINVSCGNMITEELSGIPNFVKCEWMDQYSTINAKNSESTQWSAPQLIQTANDLATNNEYSGSVILLDDLHELNSSTSPYMLEFLLERKLGQYKLDDNVAIVSTMNDSDEANFDGMSSAMRNRLAILKLKFDFDTWYKEFGNKYHFYISSFLKTHSTYVVEDESTKIEGYATPRSWEFLSTTFHSLDRNFIIENSNIISSQYISKSASIELQRHIAYIEAIDFSNIIKNKEKINIYNKKAIDQILFAYIINYVETIEDAKYVMELIDDNIDSSNFIGFIVGEIYIKSQLKESGSELSKGINALINIMMNEPYDGKKLTKKEEELFNSLSFKEYDKLFKLASEFII
jgi:ATP-dependent Lon protease